MMSDIKGIIFDLGNTLHPNWEIIDKSLKEVLENRGFDFPSFMKIFDPEYEPFMGGFLSENSMLNFFKILDWEYNSDILDEFRDILRTKHIDVVEKDEHRIWSFLRMIAPHYKLGIFSDNSIHSKNEWGSIFEETGNNSPQSAYICYTLCKYVIKYQIKTQPKSARG